MKNEKLENLNLPKIKNCPFCGGHGTLAKKSKTVIKGELTYITYCYCADCNARSRRVILAEFGEQNDARLLAINHWNRRI